MEMLSIKCNVGKSKQKETGCSEHTNNGDSGSQHHDVKKRAQVFMADQLWVGMPELCYDSGCITLRDPHNFFATVFLSAK